MIRRHFLGMLLMFAAIGSRPSAQKDVALQVFKDPTCGCCSLWVEHLRKAGFTAKVTDVEDMTAIKAKHRVPSNLRSCHTALIGGYVVEGHVPAADVQRMLKDRPAMLGIAVPGMPIGSPGMEVAGMKPHPYDVLAFDKTGETRVFASYR